MDTVKGVITHVQADFADSRDSLHLPHLVDRLQTRLRHNELRLRELVADTGYSNGFNYAFLEHRGVTPWIPVFGAYKPVIEGFTYHAVLDEYRCRADKPLPLRKYRPTADGVWMKLYRAFYQDCQACPRPTTNNSCARPSTTPIGGRGIGSVARRPSTCAGSGSALSNLYWAAYFSIMGCDGSARKVEQPLIKRCCLPPLPIT